MRITILTLLTAAPSLLGTSIFTLPTAALPSSVGWTYLGTSPEPNFWNTAPGGIEMNTMGGANAKMGYYLLPGSVVPGVVEVLWRMRVLESQGNYGFYVQVDTGSNAYLMQFSTTTISSLGTASTLVFDTSSVFHDYRFVVDTVAGTGNLYIDGSLTSNYTGGQFSSIDGDSILFGDGTSFGNAHVLLGEVPEPSAFALTALGLLALAARPWRKTKPGVGGPPACSGS